MAEFDRSPAPPGQVDCFEVPGAFEIPLLAQKLARSGRYDAPAVLTPRDFHEHGDHQRFFSEHFVKKGIEVARACLETIAGLRRAGLVLAASDSADGSG